MNPLNGWIAAAAMSEADADAVRQRLRRATTLYGGEACGESVKYWGYATLHLAVLDDHLRRLDLPALDPATLDGTAQRPPDELTLVRDVHVTRPEIDTPFGPPLVWTADLTAACPAPVERLVRHWVVLLPSVVLVVDEIDTTSATTVSTQFVIDNRDGRLDTHRHTDTRLVFRHGAAAMKLFQLGGTADDADSTGSVQHSWAALHDSYDPRPDAFGQSKEGSGEVWTFMSSRPGHRHRAVYSFVVDAEPLIRRWHVRIDGATVHVEVPDQGWFTLDLSLLLPGCEDRQIVQTFG